MTLGLNLLIPVVQVVGGIQANSMALISDAAHNFSDFTAVLINLTAIILPWLETFLGLFLIFGLWLPGAVTVMNLLLIAFFGALIFNLARGLDVHCGCFNSVATGGPATAWYPSRDAACLLMGGFLFFKVVLTRGLSTTLGRNS